MNESSDRVRTIRNAALVLIGGACLIQLVRPARTNPPTDPGRTLASVTRAPVEVRSVLERACRDCHSNDTRWPWYSNVAPVSWFVIDHVNHGRSHFNYSDWAQYKKADAEKLIKDSCEFARDGSMPLPEYVHMHSDTRLSAEDIEALCSWVAH